MARTKKSEAAAVEATQEAQEHPHDVQEQQNMPQDTQGQEPAQEAAEAVQEGAVTQEVIGPEDPADLLGCQDGDEAELMEGLLVEYAVTAQGGLRLREAPSTEAPVLAMLPCGAGVLAEGEPEGGWLYVRTGRLEGWMMVKHLEALSVAAYGTE